MADTKWLPSCHCYQPVWPAPDDLGITTITITITIIRDDSSPSSSSATAKQSMVILSKFSPIYLFIYPVICSFNVFTWVVPMCGHMGEHYCNGFSPDCWDALLEGSAELRPSPRIPGDEVFFLPYFCSLFSHYICCQAFSSNCICCKADTCSNCVAKPSPPSEWREATWPRNISVLKSIMILIMDNSDYHYHDHHDNHYHDYQYHL